jgi:hypothetical protein
MSRPSRLLLVAMSTAFGICIFGLLLGMFYDLYAIYVMHRPSENILGNSIPYNKALGGFGILGFALFLAFLVSLVSKKSK